MEKLFVNNNFPYAEVVPIANGSSWTAENICREIATKFKTKKYAPDLIVVWIDLEKQSCGSSRLGEMIRQSLIESGAPEDAICVCVPDQMTENVILADEFMVRMEFGIEGYKYSFEGENGKARLRQFYEAKRISYRETSHGVRLLKKIRLENAAENSPSAKAFYERIAKRLDCWWFNAPKAA